MSHTKHIIVIPGLGNGVARHKWATTVWKKYDVIPHVFDVQWRIKENGFNEKFERALQLIDSLTKRNVQIALIGNSAGSSFALNLFGARKKQISHVIVNCGRVRDGDWPWFTFAQATASSPSFKESVLKAQEIEKTFTIEDRKKILTLRPLFDEVVPPSTIPICGAYNKVTCSIGHGISIVLNMTVCKKNILDFILTS